MINKKNVEFIVPPLGELIETTTTVKRKILIEKMQIEYNKRDGITTNENISSILQVYLELSTEILIQVPEISETLRLMAMNQVCSLSEKDSVILEAIDFREPRISEKIKKIRLSIEKMYSLEVTIEGELLIDQTTKGDMYHAEFFDSFQRIAMPELGEVEKTLTFFEYSIQTLEFSKTRASAKKWMAANQVTLRVYFVSNISMFVSLCAFYDQENHVGIIILVCAFGLNLISNVILCLSPPFVIEGLSSWVNFLKREEHWRHLKQSFLYLQNLLKMQPEPTHESLYLSTTPYQVHYQIKRIEEAWNAAMQFTEALINQIFKNFDQSPQDEELLEDLKQIINKIKILKIEVIRVIVAHTNQQYDATHNLKENMRQRDWKELKDFKHERMFKPDFHGLIEYCNAYLQALRDFEKKLGMESITFPALKFLMVLKEEIPVFDLNCDQNYEAMKVCSVYWGKILCSRLVLKTSYFLAPAFLTGFVQFHRLFSKSGSRWLKALSLLFAVFLCIAVILLIAGFFYQLSVRRREEKFARVFHLHRSLCPPQPFALKPQPQYQPPPQPQPQPQAQPQALPQAQPQAKGKGLLLKN